MTVDLSFELIGLEGKIIPDTNAGKVLDKLLSVKPDGDLLKQWGFVKAIREENKITLDASDKKLIFSILEADRDTIGCVKAQIMEAFNIAELEANKK